MSDDENIDEILNELLIDKDDHCCPGTFWVIREPEHGEKINGIVSLNAEGGKNFAKGGEVYCLNCKQWNEHQDTSKAKSCTSCSAPYAAKWFPQKDYIVEVDGKKVGDPLPYEQAVTKAQQLREPTNVVIVSAVSGIS
tara:strand:+ start:5501 stop:5914 length:414 start_codon:yes stop_codon:yes gene_type:complete